VEHCVNTIREPGQPVRISQIPDSDLGTRATESGGLRRIPRQNPNRIAPFEQRAHQMGTDESRGSRHEYFHAADSLRRAAATPGSGQIVRKTRTDSMPSEAGTGAGLPSSIAL
jgi:hypothetical protein